MRTITFFWLVILAAGTLVAANTVDGTDKYAWSENVGWQNWRSALGGVTILRTGAERYLAGTVWSENIGWIKLGAGAGPYANTGAGNYGVNVDASGGLSGYAWSETCGWINFCPANGSVTSRVTLSGSLLDGYAWGENVGWVHFRNAAPAYNVRFMNLGSVMLIR